MMVTTRRQQLELEQKGREEREGARRSRDVQQIVCNFDGFNFNPMLNDVILKHLFEVVGHRELNTFRQVCKHWYNLSLASWLKNGPPIVLKKNMDWKRFKDVIDPDRGRPSPNLSEIVGIQRYPKFSLKGYRYGKQPKDMLWGMYAPWLTHLTVNYDGFPGVVRFLNLLTCKFTPNLVYLEVECKWVFEGEEDERRELPMDVVETENENLKVFRVDYSEPNKKLPMDWKTLLSHYPNLEHFSIGHRLSGCINLQMEPILNAIKDIRQDDKSKLNLKSLTWFYNVRYPEIHHVSFRGRNPLPPSVPRLYRESKLRIETFRVAFTEEDPHEIADNILSTFASSVRNLELHKYGLFQQLPRFWEMTQLASLTLCGYPVENLGFLAQLPNLRSLNLWRDLTVKAVYAGSIISATHMPHLTFPLMTQFRCNYTVSWRDADLSRLRDLMPNLTQLELYLDNATFRLVCQHWPLLEHIIVRCYKPTIGDAGIVGLAKDGPEIIYRQPNITNLTELKSFEMDYDPGRIQSINKESKEDFSEHSVLGGFCNLRQLQRLVIRNTKIDPDAAELMRTKIPFAKLGERGVDDHGRW